MRILYAALFVMMSTTVSLAQEPGKLSEDDRATIVAEVVRHFRENPEELVEAIVEWRAKNPDASETQAAAARLPDPVTGRMDAPVSIIEFSDYGCAPCNAVSTVLDGIADETPDIRIIHRDAPRSSVDAVAASIDLISSASKGGDWHAMRRKFLSAGVKPETRITAIAEAGVEVNNADRAKAAQTMTVSKGLAERSGIKELPALIVVVGNKVKVLPGMQSKESILEAVVSVRKAAAAPSR